MADTTESLLGSTTIDELLALQRADGGWSQSVPELKSDAFATGQTLYVLSLDGYSAERPEIKRGTDFLVATWDTKLSSQAREELAWYRENRSLFACLVDTTEDSYENNAATLLEYCLSQPGS